ISASIGSTLRIAANPGAHVPARAVIAKVGLEHERHLLAESRQLARRALMVRHAAMAFPGSLPAAWRSCPAQRAVLVLDLA
ncbi:MAG: hypothetical protein MUF54_07505, partial [Polyangiaceae bacterium]|nr:hypothetical protein [Polyangiaceae bacterium]